MSAGVEILLLILLISTMLEGCGRNDSTGIEEWDPEENKDEIKKKQEPIDETCVCNACVMCKSASAESTPLHIKKDNATIEVGDLYKLNKKDITLEKTFEGCKEIGKCIVSNENIENQEWMDTDVNMDNNQEALKVMNSYMVCTAGPGIIYFIDAGQQLKDFIDQVEIEDIELLELAHWLKNMEIGDIYELNNTNYVKDGNKVVGIKIQNANDGYITIGYGHAIQSNEEAEKYGLDKIPGFENFDFSIKNSIDDINNFIQAYEKYYTKDEDQDKDDDDSVDARLSLEDAELLLIKDLKEFRELTISVIGGESEKTKYSKNQLDGITSILFNGNHYDDPDSLSYYFINQLTKEDSLSILHTAVENGWYGDNETGILRRRLMEVNIYYNADYTFYDSDRTDELKEDTGYTK